MTQRPHDAARVRAHYASLAATYDEKANKACKRAYVMLLRRTLSGCSCVLELGAGSSPLLDIVRPAHAVACDLSWPMLAARHTAPEIPRTVADGCALPFRSASFDGLFSINVLEHVVDPELFLAEAARVLRPGAIALAVTPNGDLAWLLELLERLRLKLPEGPHQFLGTARLAALAAVHFDTVEHKKFLACPAGPDAWVKFADDVGRPAAGRGLFQYIILRRRVA